jgi:hypothetical protein
VRYFVNREEFWSRIAQEIESPRDRPRFAVLSAGWRGRMACPPSRAACSRSSRGVVVAMLAFAGRVMARVSAPTIGLRADRRGRVGRGS